MGLPAVGSERNDRHSPVIFQVPYLEIPEAITYGYRFFHLIRFYQDGFLVCIERGGCRMECPVGSGYFESFDTGPSIPDHGLNPSLALSKAISAVSPWISILR